MATLAVDSSALIAVIKGEPEENAFTSALWKNDVLVGWPTVLEMRIWLLRRPEAYAVGLLDHWLGLPHVETLAFDGTLERIAASAYERFGRGLHPAKLNFGDCMSYAVAVHHDAPLLFKGGDFGRTDVRVHSASTVLG